MTSKTQKTARTLEVRPGEGGDDAVLFAHELLDALSSYAQRQGIALSLKGEQGRTLVAELDRSDAVLEEMVGCHRVQRIPGNGKGKRHTSTATVALLSQRRAEARLEEKDLEVQFYRGTGPGGQHRNKVSTAVRLTHRPSGIVVTVEHGRSQSANLQWAKEEVLRRLQAGAEEGAAQAVQEERTSQIASSERPVKSYTHNEQRSEVVCHETGKRWRRGDFSRGRL